MASHTIYLTTQKYADKVGVSSSTVSKWLRDGKLKGKKENGKWLIEVTSTTVESKSTPQSSESPTSETVQLSNDQSYTIEKFSEMTYLTEFGVTAWLKAGRLKGVRNSSGKWQVSSENLKDQHVRRLLRKG